MVDVAPSSSNPIRVLIVDDDPLALSSLDAYFTEAQDIQVAAEARGGIEALSVLDKISVDIVLADIHMPEMDGVTLLHEINRRPNPPLFIAITALDTDETMLEVLAGGGAGYIVKSARPQTIVTALRDAVDGGTTVSPQALKRLVSYLSDSPKAPLSLNADGRILPFDSLTNVERTVLDYLCEGKSNAEIAQAMNYSESTVKKQVSHLISLFGVTSRLSLVVSALRAGYTRN